MGYYPAFPPAVPRMRVGCIRVTHPCATLASPKGRLPFDLHVLGLPLAFILSQDQTLHCILLYLIIFSVVPGGFTCSSLFGILGSLPFRLLFIGSLLSKNFAIIISVDCGCKSTPIFYTRNTFFKIFLNYFFKADYQRFVRQNFEKMRRSSCVNSVSKALAIAFFTKFLRQSYAETEKSH